MIAVIETCTIARGVSCHVKILKTSFVELLQNLKFCHNATAKKFMDCNIFFSHAAKLEHFYFESKKLLVNYMDELYTKEKFKATRMTSDERVQQTARNRHCHQAIHPFLMGL